MAEGARAKRDGSDPPHYILEQEKPGGSDPRHWVLEQENIRREMSYSHTPIHSCCIDIAGGEAETLSECE